MDQRYEYVVVDLPTRAEAKRKDTRYDDLVSQALNAVSRHGWRLMAVHPQSANPDQAVFEREVRGE